jgi:hypothetical protein
MAARPQCDTTPLLNNCSLWRSFKFNSFIHLDACVFCMCEPWSVSLCVLVCVFVCLVLLCWWGDVREAAMAGWATGMRGAWAWYQSRLLQQPVRTQMVTSGILWAAGDAMAQSVSRVMEKRSPARDNSTTTTVRARSLSVCVCVCVCVCVSLSLSLSLSLSVSPICCRNLNHYYQSLNFLFWAQFGVLNLNQKIRV